MEKRGHNVLLEGYKSNKLHKTICLYSAVHFQMAHYVYRKENAHHFFFSVYVHLLNRQPYSLSYTYTWIQVAPQNRPSLSAWQKQSLWQIFMVIISVVVLMSFKILRTGLSIHCPVQMVSILPKHTPIYLASHHWEIVCINVQYLLNVLRIIIPQTKG